MNEFVLGNAHRLLAIPQSVFGNDLVLALAEKKANRRGILWRLYLRVDRRQVEAQLPKVLGFEVRRLEFNDDIGV